MEAHKNQSFVYVGVDNNLAGLIYFEDKIREDAGQVVRSLSTQGISIYMLSGDKRNTAEYVASEVGIPKEKVRKFSNICYLNIVFNDYHLISKVETVALFSCYNY